MMPTYDGTVQIVAFATGASVCGNGLDGQSIHGIFWL